MPSATRLLTAIALILSLLIMPFVGAEFMPKLDEGALWVRATMPYTISYDEAARVTPKIRDILRSFPQVTTVSSELGGGAATAPVLATVAVTCGVTEGCGGLAVETCRAFGAALATDECAGRLSRNSTIFCASTLCFAPTGSGSSGMSAGAKYACVARWSSILGRG